MEIIIICLTALVYRLVLWATKGAASGSAVAKLRGMLGGSVQRGGGGSGEEQ